MNLVKQIQVKTRGRITLPKDWLRANAIEDGDLVALTDMGNGVFLMRPYRSKVNRLANQLSKQLHKAGVTRKALLKELRELRK